MATRSFICKQFSGTGRVRGVYCHYDGYPEGVGQTLIDNYSNDAIVNELLALGALSSLGSTLDNTVAYHRDRGEELDIEEFDSLEAAREYARFDAGAEYMYIWDGVRWTGY